MPTSYHGSPIRATLSPTRVRSGLLQNLELGRADSAKPPCGILSADGMGVKERQTQCLPYGWRPGRLGRE